MRKNKIEKLIYWFVENKLSDQTSRRFFFWLKYNEESNLDDYMSDIWEETTGQTSDSTFDALARIRTQIDKQNNRASFIQAIAKYAAVAVIAIVCTLGVYNRYVQNSEIQEAVLMSEIFVHNGESKHVTLSDGSEVWLDAGSILVYPDHFGSQNREIYLTGQARFKVQTNELSPFIVKTKYLNVQALGTTFCVQSYPELKSVSTILEEGSVKVSTINEGMESVEAILTPNEKLTFYPQQDSISIADVDAQRLNAWIDGNLVFQDAEFESIIRSLERKYNVRINYDISKFKGHRYFLRINQDESIEDALTLMSYMISDFRFKINNSVITIY